MSHIMTAQLFCINKVWSLPARMRMSAEIKNGIVMPPKNCSYLVGVLYCKEWLQGMIVQLAFRATVQNRVIEWAMGKNDGGTPGVLGQCRLQKGKCFLCIIWFWISYGIKHDAQYTILRPEITHRFAPESSIVLQKVLYTLIAFSI